MRPIFQAGEDAIIDRVLVDAAAKAGWAHLEGHRRRRLVEFTQYSEWAGSDDFLQPYARGLDDVSPKGCCPISVGNFLHSGGIPRKGLHNIEVSPMFDSVGIYFFDFVLNGPSS
jgi:hypothetical protein